MSAATRIQAGILRTTSSASSEGIRHSGASLEAVGAPFRVATVYRGRVTVRNVRVVHAGRGAFWSVLLQIDSRVERSWTASEDDREHPAPETRRILRTITDPRVVALLEKRAPEVLR